MGKKSRLHREAAASQDTSASELAAPEPALVAAPDVEASPDPTVIVTAEPDAESTADVAVESETAEPATAPVVFTESELAIIRAYQAQVAAARSLLEANGYRVVGARSSTGSGRSTDLKADPDEVKAYFAATGLTRKQIAGAVGVCTSVIATVQNPNGDRWSQERYERAKVLIDAEVARINAPAQPETPVAETTAQEPAAVVAA